VCWEESAQGCGLIGLTSRIRCLRNDSGMEGDWEQHADRLAAASLAAGDATGWFEELYAAGRAGSVAMPWSREQPHPLLADWTRERRPDGTGLRAVVVGCGLGADAEHVAALGYDTVAFDVSSTGVDLARDWHPGTAVRYVVADLLALPPAWVGAFDLVVEVYTVQALPEPPRRRAIGEVGRLVAPGGTLVVVAASRGAADPVPDGPPWPLTRDEVEAFAAGGLTTVRIDHVPDRDDPAFARWLAEYRRR
jgi:SAM-dependent methyltransferase